MTRATLAALLALASGAQAQSAVRGRIVSSLDKRPIFAAEIVSADGRSHARTDDQGRFAINAQHGDSVRVRALGYSERRFALRPADTLIVLEAFTTELPSVITTAGQRTIRVNETTSSVAVVDRADIDATAAVGANQLLRTLPGLQELPSPPSKSTMAIRGLDAARVLVLVDGEPVPGALIDNRDIGRLSSVAAQRIEITKGPSSVEFGSDALGGVINLVTAPPGKTPALQGMVRFGELGRSESTLDLTNTIGRLGFRLSGGWRQLDRLVAVNAEGSSLDRVYDLRSDVRYRATDKLSLRLNTQYSQERQRWPVGAGYNGFIDNHGIQSFAEAQHTDAHGMLRARVFGQWYDYQFRQSQHLTPIAGTGDSLEQQEKLARALLAYTRIAGPHTLDVGVQVAVRSIVAPEKIDGDEASDRVAEVFARDALTRGPVLVTAGARFTNSSLWGGAVAPSVGAAWQITPTVRSRVNVARGFRGPSFKEIRYTFVNPGAAYTIVGNPDLEPESSWSTDAGVSWAPTSSVAFDVGAYHNRVTNLIDTRLTGVNGAGFQVYQNLNVARALTEGIETSAQVDVASLSASVGYNYLRARDLEDDRPLDRRAKHSGRARLEKRWSVWRPSTTDISVHYTGAAPLGDSTQEALTSVDAQLRVEMTPNVELSVGVTNLLDERPAFYTPAFQRQVYAGAKMRIGK